MELTQSKEGPTQKQLVMYDLIILQINNLVKDLRIVFPSDIVLKVCQDNIKCLNDNKVEFIDYLKNSLSLDLRNLITTKDEQLFDKNNKSLKNLKFKRSSYAFSRIRSNWELLDNDNRNIVWKYLNFILKLIDSV